MKDELKTAFSAYLTKARTVVIESKKAFTEKQKANDSKDWLVKKITELEESFEFLSLVSTSSVTFGGKALERLDGSFSIIYMQNFLRRSGCYISIWENSFSGIDNYFDLLWNSYNKKKVRITTFRALDVFFPEDLIDCGHFKIQSLSQKEWEILSQNKTNRIFYPDAVLDSKTLSQFWFIKEEKIKDKEELFGWSLGKELDDAWEGKVKNKFPDPTLQLLALYNWNAFSSLETPEQEEKDKDWLGFSITSPLTITDNLLSTPHYASLNLPFVFDIKTEQYCGQETGEVVEEEVEYEKPYYAIDEVTEDELGEIKDLIKKARGFSKIRPEKWNFFDIAMGYLAKAFFAEGLEQLLWHITVLESLFSKNREPYKMLKKRMDVALGSVISNNKFEELYDFRSELVHGKVPSDNVRRYHLWQARNLARQSVAWFLDYLLDIHDKLGSKNMPIEDFPEREEILISLDLEDSQKHRLKFLLAD